MSTGNKKDLLLYTADADALALMSALLRRPKALGIRPISFDADRHPQRDSGMVQSGPELVRMKKSGYHKVLLLWDFAGCGREHRLSPEALETEIQQRLDGCTWSGRSAAAVLVPELEVWLWHCQPALAAHCGKSLSEVDEWVEGFAQKLGKPLDALKSEQPKELFEYLIGQRLRRTISPRDFDEIGKKASLKTLRNCASFARINDLLRGWFPPPRSTDQ